MKYEAIFFDWDGVITDSVNIKTESFMELFQDYGKAIQEKVKEHHLVHGGVSRFEKFKIYYNEFLGKEISQKEILNLSEKFSQLVKQKVIEAPFVKGVMELIKTEYNNDTLLFVVTGTPTEEIKEIAASRNVLQYFTEIEGSPKKKKEILEYLLKKYNLLPQKCLFFGDALTDYEAAKSCNINFVGIKIDGCTTEFPDGVKVISEVTL